MAKRLVRFLQLQEAPNGAKSLAPKTYSLLYLFCSNLLAEFVDLKRRRIGDQVKILSAPIPHLYF